jgi:hypothetical protein
MSQIADLHTELVLYQAIYDDYVAGNVPVINIRTDAVYKDFCERHPDIQIEQQQFTQIMCRGLDLKSKQSRLDGVRGSFYECA